MTLLAIPAFAQDNAAGEITETAADSEQIVESEEAAQDETVTEEDLGAKTPGRFHFFKRFTRTVQKAVTRDPIKKAEFEIEEAHEELLRAKQIAEERPDDPATAAKVEKALEKFESNIEKVKNRAQDIKEKKADQAGAFMEKIADMQIKQQKMLDNLEEKLPEQAFEKIQLTRERALQHSVEIMTKVAENKEQIAERMNAAMEKQTGSEFKEFKNMEIMERVREHMPEEMKDAIDEVQEQARERFEIKIKELPIEERGEKFNTYIEHVKGNAVQQLKVLEEIKVQGKIPQEFIIQIEQAKEQAIMKFESKMESFENPVHKELFMKNLESGDVQNLKVMEQLREHMPENIKAKIEEKQTKAMENLRIKIESTENPEVFDRIKAEIDANPILERNMIREHSDFGANLEAKTREIGEIKARQQTQQIKKEPLQNSNQGMPPKQSEIDAAREQEQNRAMQQAPTATGQGSSGGFNQPDTSGRGGGSSESQTPKPPLPPR